MTRRFSDRARSNAESDQPCQVISEDLGFPAARALAEKAEKAKKAEKSRPIKNLHPDFFMAPPR